jgi:hypothetical protein
LIVKTVEEVIKIKIGRMMERRSAYAEFEKVIINLYEQKILTLALLDDIAHQYSQVGVDSAGSQYMRAYDGKDLCQICIELIDPAFPIVVRGSSEDHEEYWEQEFKKWQEIVSRRWELEPEGYRLPVQKQQEQGA